MRKVLSHCLMFSSFLLSQVDVTQASAQGRVATPARAEASYRISPAQLACLKEHAAAYRRIRRDPILIPLNRCPEVPDNAILDSLVAEGPRTGAVRRTDGPDAILYLRRNQLECLLRAQPQRGARLYRFWPRRCQLEPAQ